MIRFIFGITLLLLSCTLKSQEAAEVSRAFYDTRIVNGHSVETNAEGTMKFIISHRFGEVKGGIFDLFGLDNSNIRFGFDYGIKDWLTVGIGRSSFEKTYDGFLKVKILQQQKGEKNIPISITALSTMAINGLKWQNPDRKNYFTSRLFYAYQLLISQSYGNKFSLQIMPSMVHRNIIPNTEVKHDVFALGTAAKLSLIKWLTLNAEYYYVFPNQLDSRYKNSLSVGLDFKTGGHVFQLHFTNSRGMTEKFFITETTGKWLDGNIHFGFNITRDFKIKSKKEKQPANP